MSHHGKHGHGQFDSQAGQQELAYHLWEQAGRPEGQAQHFWAAAGEQIKGSRQPVASSWHEVGGGQRKAS